MLAREIAVGAGERAKRIVATSIRLCTFLRALQTVALRP